MLKKYYSRCFLRGGGGGLWNAGPYLGQDHGGGGLQIRSWERTNKIIITLECLASYIHFDNALTAV